MNYEIRLKFNNRDIYAFKIKANSPEEAIEKCKVNNPITYYYEKNQNRESENSKTS